MPTFDTPTTLEKMGYKHPKHPLIKDWSGRKKWVDDALKTYKPSKLVSANTKTQDPSLNLPIVGHCINRTQLCNKICYAQTGTLAFSLSVLKTEYLSRYLLGTDLRQLIGECSRFKSIRLNGGGDLLPGHVPAIIKLARACKETVFWGMSRNKNVLKSINGARLKNLSLLYSIDATTPVKEWKDFQGGMVWGPRLASDKIPEDRRIKVIFPYHSQGKVGEDMPTHYKDCRAVINKELHCNQCRRCWNSKPFGG